MNAGTMRNFHDLVSKMIKYMIGKILSREKYWKSWPWCLKPVDVLFVTTRWIDVGENKMF